MSELERTHSAPRCPAAKATKRSLHVCVWMHPSISCNTYNNLAHKLEKRYIKDSLNKKTTLNRLTKIKIRLIDKKNKNKVKIYNLHQPPAPKSD